MKKIVVSLLVLGFVFAGFASFALANGGNGEKTVNICHHKKHGQIWVFKTIKKNSLPGHLRHGDFLYKGRPDVYDWEMTDWCNINAPQ